MALLFTYAYHYFLASSRIHALGESWTSFWAGGSLPSMFGMVRMRVHEGMGLLPESFELGYSPWDNLGSPPDVSSMLMLRLSIIYLSWQT